MNKKLIAFLSALSLLLSFSFIPANADSANPPVITGFTQVTQGPYKPGDMIQFKIEYTGGNPGLSDYWIMFGNKCVTIKDRSVQYHWSKSSGGQENEFFGNGLFTGFIDTCSPGIYDVARIWIKDKTDLFSKKVFAGSFGNGAEKFEIADYEFKPVPAGMELPSVKLPDELDLMNIPKNPKVGSFFSLPSRTKVGFPVGYGIKDINNSACQITKDGFNSYTPFFGGTLTFNKSGTCQIYIGRSEVSSRTKYDPLTLKVNGKNQDGMIIFSTINTNSSSAITCIKGKTSKKIAGKNPKCPSGYKLKE